MTSGQALQDDLLTFEELLEENEDYIFGTAAVTAFVSLISFIATLRQEGKAAYTLTYHWRMLCLWIFIPSAVVFCIASILCMLRMMDMKIESDHRKQNELDSAKKQAESERRRADAAEAKLAECQEACCKKPDGSRPTKGTSVHNGHRSNPRPTTNNDRRLYN